MNVPERQLVQGALAALTQNRTYAADVKYARECLEQALWEDRRQLNLAEQRIRALAVQS